MFRVPRHHHSPSDGAAQRRRDDAVARLHGEAHRLAVNRVDLYQPLHQRRDDRGMNEEEHRGDVGREHPPPPARRRTQGLHVPAHVPGVDPGTQGEQQHADRQAREPGTARACKGERQQDQRRPGKGDGRYRDRAPRMAGIELPGAGRSRAQERSQPGSRRGAHRFGRREEGRDAVGHDSLLSDPASGPRGLGGLTPIRGSACRRAPVRRQQHVEHRAAGLAARDGHAAAVPLDNRLDDRQAEAAAAVAPAARAWSAL